jgi:ribonucleotide monophosphatase NagD (HAD superfamily)
MDVVLQRLGLPAEQCVMVGDRLETDMLMGRQTGMKTAMVLTGASSRDDVARETLAPDFVLDSIGDIPDRLVAYL